MEQEYQEVDFSHTSTLSASISLRRYKIVDMLVTDTRVPLTEEVLYYIKILYRILNYILQHIRLASGWKHPEESDNSEEYDTEFVPIVVEMIRRGLELPEEIHPKFKEKVNDKISQNLKKSARK